MKIFYEKNIKDPETPKVYTIHKRGHQTCCSALDHMLEAKVYKGSRYHLHDDKLDRVALATPSISTTHVLGEKYTERTHTAYAKLPGMFEAMTFCPFCGTKFELEEVQ